MSAQKGRKKSDSNPTRLVDVFLVDREAALQAVAAGNIHKEVVSFNVWKLRDWAIDTAQPEGIINGVKIVDRKGDNPNGKKREDI